MRDHHHIRYLRRKEINDLLWDQCMNNAENGLVYGYTFYLDAMAGQWDGLVLNDYEAVMPLPLRKKFGIHYSYQPFLTAQLGVFGNKLNAELLSAFLDAIPSRLRLLEFSLNHGNVFQIENYPLHLRKNYVLDLRPPYEQLWQGYRDNTKRNLKKSLQYGCSVEKDIAVEQVIELAMQQALRPDAGAFEKFADLYRRLRSQELAETYGIVSRQKELLASCVFLFSHQRAYYILVGNHPNGRTLGASHALIDAFIKDHAGQELLLDFEGSDIRNLAFFYSGFGAREENYAAIRLNRLPWYARWLKK